MKLKIDEKLKAICLREKGYSLAEIVEKISVAKSSVSVWVRNVPLSKTARKRLLTKISVGQMISAEKKRARTTIKLEAYRLRALEKIRKVPLTPDLQRMICSLIYWCEGGKSFSRGVEFTNSDPSLVYCFLKLFRSSFSLDESKFRVCIHLHEYHDEVTQIDFWSKITRIKKQQFIRPYLKPHTGKRVKKGYQGCVSVRYHDSDVAKQLLTTAQAFLAFVGP